MSYKPEFPYLEDQIIFNSNRITLNSKKDSIFLFSNKIINLSSNNGIHINTDEDIHINGNKIFLGLKANEPLVKGNKLMNLFKQQFNDLENIGKQLSEAVDSNNNPIPAVNTAGSSLVKSVRKLNILLKNINSDKNYTL